jgi:hypothetical protein
VNVEACRRDARGIAAKCLRLEPTFKVLNIVERGADSPVPRADRVIWMITFRRNGQMYEQSIDVTDEERQPETFAQHKLSALSSALRVLKGEAQS